MGLDLSGVHEGRCRGNHSCNDHCSQRHIPTPTISILSATAALGCQRRTVIRTIPVVLSVTRRLRRLSLCSVLSGGKSGGSSASSSCLSKVLTILQRQGLLDRRCVGMDNTNSQIRQHKISRERTAFAMWLSGSCDQAVVPHGSWEAAGRFVATRCAGTQGVAWSAGQGAGLLV